MAKNGFKFIDPDLHVFEPADLWQRYIEPRYRDSAPVGLSSFPNDMCMMHEGKLIARYSRPTTSYSLYTDNRRDRYQDFHARHFAPDVELEAMDTEGIDLAVLYPTRGFYAVGKEYDDDGLAAAVARAYNNWLAEYCSADPALVWLGVGPSPECRCRDTRSAATEKRAWLSFPLFKAQPGEKP